MVNAVLADGTAAGEIISNTATATYQDEDNNTINTTSNTVTIDVGEVPGLTVVPAGITDVDGGSVEAGDTVYFDFEITNVGNYPTDIFIPDENGVTPTNFTPTEVQILNPGGGAPTTVTANGAQVEGDLSLGLVSPDQSITVRVIGTVPTSGVTSGQPVKVQLGDTGPNDNSALSQNQDDTKLMSI